jgi:hypothetical protein
VGSREGAALGGELANRGPASVVTRAFSLHAPWAVSTGQARHHGAGSYCPDVPSHASPRMIAACSQSARAAIEACARWRRRWRLTAARAARERTKRNPGGDEDRPVGDDDAQVEQDAQPEQERRRTRQWRAAQVERLERRIAQVHRDS